MIPLGVKYVKHKSSRNHSALVFVSHTRVTYTEMLDSQYRKHSSHSAFLAVFY